MASSDRVRLDLGFEGGSVLSATVSPAEADALEARLRGGEDTVADLDTDDGKLIVVLSRVLYVRRHAREGRVGFSAP